MSSWERRAPLQYSWVRSRRQQERQSSWFSETPTSGQSLTSVNQIMDLTVLRAEIIQDPIDEDWHVKEGLEETDPVAEVHGMVDHTPLGRERHARRVNSDVSGLPRMSVECPIWRWSMRLTEAFFWRMILAYFASLTLRVVRSSLRLEILVTSARQA